MLQNLKRKTPGRPAHLVEHDFQDAPPQSYLEAAMAPPPPVFEAEDLDLTALDGLEPQAQIEVLAVMAKQGFRFKRPQGGGAGGLPSSASGISLAAARCHHPGGAMTFHAPTAVGKATLRQNADSPKWSWPTGHASIVASLAIRLTSAERPRKLHLNQLKMLNTQFS